MRTFGECHAHVFMNGIDYQKAVRMHQNDPDEAHIRSVLQTYADLGISFVRDGGDHFGASALAKKLAPSYGISYLTPIFAIYKDGNYGSVVGHSFTDFREFEMLVKKARAEGADFIKIMTSGIMTFRKVGELTGYALPYDTVAAMTEIAHENGLCVMSHTNGAEAVLAAVRAGVDSIEHGNFQNEESICALAESDTIWVPTTVTIQNLIGSGRFDDTVLADIYADVSGKIRFAYRRGAKIALGSDAGAYRVLHGQGILDEQRSLTEILKDEPNCEERFLQSEKSIRSWRCRA